MTGIQPTLHTLSRLVGRTGISFSALGRALGHPVTIFMPDWMSQERKDLIRSFGAEVRLVSHAEGGFLGSIRLSEAWAAETPDAFLPCQVHPQDLDGDLYAGRAQECVELVGIHRPLREVLSSGWRPARRLVQQGAMQAAQSRRQSQHRESDSVAALQRCTTSTARLLWLAPRGAWPASACDRVFWSSPIQRPCQRSRANTE